MSAEPIYLASIAFTQNPDLYALCLKSASRQGMVLPVLCPRDIAGMALVAQRAQLPADVIYRVLHNVLCRDGYYVGGVELSAGGDSIPITANIIRIHEEQFTHQSIPINVADGIVFAYINDVSLLTDSDLAQRTFVDAARYFTDATSSEEFRNDHLLNRRK